MATESLTAYPSKFIDTGNYASKSNENNPIGRGASFTGTPSSFSARRVAVDVEYSFDLSAIPEGAEITSVSMVVAVRATYQTTATLKLISGTTTIYSASKTISNNSDIQTVSGGNWTRSMLNDFRLGLAIQSFSQQYQNLNFYGADLTVTYTYQSEKFMLKLGGAWHDIARVFKKVNGIWVEQTDLANVIEDGVRYQNGGEYVAPVQKRTVTITGTGDATASYVTINGTKYTSAATVQVDDGDVVQATVAGGGFGSTPSISVNGTQKVSGAGTYNHTVTSDCTVNLKVPNEGFGNYGIIAITTGGSGGANLISFTIAGTSYQAEEGMTWGEWVASSYNSGTWADMAGSVMNSNGEIVCLGSEYQYAEIKTTDTIISGYAYDITI